VNPTLSIGRIAGIRIGLNWSWTIVFALIVWSLAAEVFPAQNPGLGTGAYVGMAVVAALLLFGSLLLHELGHAVQARREGMEVADITLWLFGGVARFKGDFPSAGAEFRIAIAGPLVTVLSAGVFVGFAVAVDSGSAVDGVAAWLGYINLVILAFNLLPALPLDGGRVLRAALWQARGSFRWATRTAVGVSRAFAFLMIGTGVAILLAGGSVSGVWLAFIGWFLLQAAGSEVRYLLVHEALAGLRVHDVMEPHPVTASPEQTLGEFVSTVPGAARFTAYPVLEHGHVVGLLPFRRVLATPWQAWDARHVGDCMLTRDEAPEFGADDSAVEALQTLAEAPLQRGLVVDDGRLVGLVSISDFARLLALASRPRDE
jgi:Zn-dependent protease/CBS domain-containing protein